MKKWLATRDEVTLRDLQATITYHLAHKKSKLTDRELYYAEMLFDGVLRYLYEQYRLHPVPVGIYLQSHDNYKLFVNAYRFANLFFEQEGKINYQTVQHKGAMMFLIGRLLASYVCQTMPPDGIVSINRVMRMSRYIGAAIDYHFPGYISSGMVSVVLERLVARVQRDLNKDGKHAYVRELHDNKREL